MHRMKQANAAGGGGSAKWALLVFGALAVVYLATATYDVVQITDTQASAVTAWSLGEGAGFTLPWSPEEVPWGRESVSGATVTDRFPGASILAAPFYAVWPGGSAPAGPLDVPFAPAGIAAAVLTATAMAVLFVALDELTCRRAALFTTAAIGLGTATWSVSADSLFTHGPGQLALALALLAVGRARWTWAGLALAASVVIRPQLGVAAAVIGVGLALTRRSLRPALGIGLTSALGVGALAMYTKHFFGSWLPIAGYAPWKVQGVVDAVDPSGGASWLHRLVDLAGAWALTFGHPLRGLFVYSPVLLVLVVGVVLLGRRSVPDWVWLAALAGLAVMTVQLASNPVWFGGNDFFAYRLPLEMVTLAAPFLAIGAAHLLDHGSGPRLVLLATGVASVVVFALGSTVLDPRVAQRGEYLDSVLGLPAVTSPEREAVPQMLNRRPARSVRPAQSCP